MRKVEVNLGSNSYDIYIGSGLLVQTAGWLRENGFAGKFVIISIIQFLLSTGFVLGS